jgi:hypothetical protein
MWTSADEFLVFWLSPRTWHPLTRNLGISCGWAEEMRLVIIIVDIAVAPIFFPCITSLLVAHTILDDIEKVGLGKCFVQCNRDRPSSISPTQMWDTIVQNAPTRIILNPQCLTP